MCVCVCVCVVLTGTSSVRTNQDEGIVCKGVKIWASLVAQSVKNPPAMQKTRDRCLVGEDPLEKEMANHSSILAWKIPRTEEPDGLWSIGFQRVRHD